VHENLSKKECLAELGGGLSIWKVHLDVLREQDKNARVMSPQKFERLVANIKKDGHLESLPLCVRHINPAGNEEFSIISGHHRTRGARAAGIMEIFVLAYEPGLTEDQVKAKQLAHNAIQGQDERQTLADLYHSIEDLSLRIETGITDQEVEAATAAVKPEDITVPLDFELVQFVFLPPQLARFEAVLKLLAPEAKVGALPVETFEAFKQAVHKVSERCDVRNIGAIMAKMCELILEMPESEPAK